MNIGKHEARYNFDIITQEQGQHSGHRHKGQVKMASRRLAELRSSTTRMPNGGMEQDCLSNSRPYPGLTT